MAQNATVKALNGQALLVTPGGEIRRLAVGDAINAGDTVRPAPGARLARALGRLLAAAGLLAIVAWLRSLAGLGGFVILVFCRLFRLRLGLFLDQGF